MSTIEVAGSSTRADGQGLFQCGACKRHYNRLDHLARHVRSHTNFKPHRCSLCGKSFSRTDLLKRHVAAHDVRNAKVNNLSRGGAADEAPGRVTQACRACATNHVRCTETKPCRRCADRGLECVFVRTDDAMTSPAPAPAAGFQPSHLMMSPSSMPSSLDVQVEEPMRLSVSGSDAAEGPLSQPVPPSLQQVARPGPVPQTLQPGTAAGPSAGAAIDQSAFDDDNFMGAQPELPTGYCTPAFTEWNFLPGLWSDADGVGIGQPFPGIELDDLDLRFLGTYNTTVPFEFAYAPQPVSPQRPSVPMRSSDADAGDPASWASEAFRNHHWRFRPNPKDHGGAEEHNLSLPSDARDHPSPDSHISFAPRVTPARLGARARDNILTIVIKSCRPENLPKAVACFPSAELLDTLIQFYLTSPQARADSFIHAATFDPNEKKPELLLAMAAAGAVLTSDPTLAKLGYAMQECVRTAIPAVWETNNSLVRNLELTQAFLINLEIGLWSGLSRKVEITESFLQSPLTMFRRGGRFRRSNYPPVALDAADQTASAAEASWRAWVQQESFKRTAFRLLQHDLNSSMYLMVNPLVSYAELSLPLPCSPCLWSAPSAQQWRSLLLQCPSLAHQPPTVADYLDDPGAFQNPRATPILLDVAGANEAFLACAWSLAAPQTARALPPDPATHPQPQPQPQPKPLPAPVPDHHHHSLPPQQQPGTTDTHTLLALHTRLDLIHLHLHAPFDEIQTLAGAEGPEAARGAYAGVADWARTEAARKAVCHAGQVLRFARRAARGMLHGPAAAGIYQAGLVLWVWGLLEARRAGGGGPPPPGKGGAVVAPQQQQQQRGVSGGEDDAAPARGRERGRGSASAGHGGEERVCLDGGEEEGLAVQRFTCFGVGRPCLRGGGGAADEVVWLADPEAVLGAILGILRDNYEGLPRPHLVERLLQLMEALQRASAGMMEFHGQLDKQ
ncbi:dafe8ccf-24ab-49ae-a8df-fc87805d4e31 [Thermothielavioides terrestris]|uniref:Dafe8ccf-24ab-49ae-a8df-fc87805d4e31 n=1 Tax=Thermothielavioides terrestris TaxID=2587410 RepID=A0A3S4ATE8_9PEZI|nr:dafe8ccf-24ab-49ae-a8df-fc87805d4e31 [Thermothielavioides terrestris]